MCMWAKRILIVSVLAVVITIGFLATGISVSRNPVCACGTVNDSVSYYLEELDVRVQRYATDNSGLYPTFDTLRAMVASDKYLWRQLTPRVDCSTQRFTFVPTKDDVHKIGYAVSDNQRDYVLLGIGLYERRIQLTDEHSLPAGYALPILRPRASQP